MQAPSRREKQATTRAAVLAAARAVFVEGGYEAATIRAIAARAGRSTGAVFANWAGKAELYRDVFGHAPISPEQGRALYLAARQTQAGPPELGAAVAMVEEA